MGSASWHGRSRAPVDSATGCVNTSRIVSEICPVEDPANRRSRVSTSESLIRAVRIEGPNQEARELGNNDMVSDFHTRTWLERLRDTVSGPNSHFMWSVSGSCAVARDSSHAETPNCRDAESASVDWRESRNCGMGCKQIAFLDVTLRSKGTKAPPRHGASPVKSFVPARREAGTAEGASDGERESLIRRTVRNRFDSGRI